MFDWIAGQIQYWFFNKYYLAYLLVSAIIAELQIAKISKFKSKTEEQKKRDENYKAFRKTDLNLDEHLWARVLFHLTCFTIIPRFLLGWGAALANFIFLRLLYIGGGDPANCHPIQKTLTVWASWITGRFIMLTFCTFWVETTYPKVCYKKYLGPDWKPEYDGAGCRVGNH